MKLRELIIRITRVAIIFILLALILSVIAYREKHNYTYVVNDKFGKSENCYIDTNNYRVCEVKQTIIKVDMYYEEVNYE